MCPRASAGQSWGSRTAAACAAAAMGVLAMLALAGEAQAQVPAGSSYTVLSATTGSAQTLPPVSASIPLKAPKRKPALPLCLAPPPSPCA